MKKLKVPEGTQQASHVNEVYLADSNGFIYVSDEAAEALVAPPHGFVLVEDLFEVQAHFVSEPDLAVKAKSKAIIALTKVAPDATTSEKEA